jgi:hypothetical protein
MIAAFCVSVWCEVPHAHQPALSLDLRDYSSGSSVGGALGSGNFDDGFLPRFLLFDQSGTISTRNHRPASRRDGIDTIEGDSWAVMTRGNRDPSVVERASALELVKQPDPIQGDGGRWEYSEKPAPRPLDVRFEADALEYNDAIADMQDALLKRYMGNGPASAVIARVHEHFGRVVLVAAVTDNPAAPVIKLEHAQWADKLVRWCVNNMLVAVEKHVADSGHEAQGKKLVEKIHKAGKGKPEGWVSLSEVTRSSQNIPKREREDLLATLVTAALLEVRVQAVDGSGRPGTYYRTPILQ